MSILELLDLAVDAAKSQLDLELNEAQDHKVQNPLLLSLNVFIVFFTDGALLIKLGRYFRCQQAHNCVHFLKVGFLVNNSVIYLLSRVDLGHEIQQGVKLPCQLSISFFVLYLGSLWIVAWRVQIQTA